MGNNFLITQAAKHRKAWAAKYAEASRDMFAKQNGKLGLKVVAKRINEAPIKAGDEILLIRKGKAVFACKDNMPFAEVSRPPAEFLAQLNRCHGTLLGELEEVHRRAKAVSVRITGAE